MNEFWIAYTTAMLAVIGGFCYLGLKNYFSETLKNVATLQSIGAITKEVEAVKKTFTDETEKLRQGLSVLTNKQNVMFVEEKEALHQYLSAWNVWYNSLNLLVQDYTSIGTRDLSNVTSISLEFSIKCKQEFDKIVVLISKIELFLENLDIINTVQSLNEISNEYQKLSHDYVLSNLWYEYEYENYLEQLLKTTDVEGRQVLSERVRTTEESKNNETLEFCDEKEKMSAKIMAQKKIFIELSRRYIRKDISV